MSEQITQAMDAFNKAIHSDYKEFLGSGNIDASLVNGLEAFIRNLGVAQPKEANIGNAPDYIANLSSLKKDSILRDFYTFVRPVRNDYFPKDFINKAEKQYVFFHLRRGEVSEDTNEFIQFLFGVTNATLFHRRGKIPKEAYSGNFENFLRHQSWGEWREVKKPVEWEDVKSVPEYFRNKYFGKIEFLGRVDNLFPLSVLLDQSFSVYNTALSINIVNTNYKYNRQSYNGPNGMISENVTTHGFSDIPNNEPGLFTSIYSELGSLNPWSVWEHFYQTLDGKIYYRRLDAETLRRSNITLYFYNEDSGMVPPIKANFSNNLKSAYIDIRDKDKINDYLRWKPLDNKDNDPIVYMPLDLSETNPTVSFLNISDYRKEYFLDGKVTAGKKKNTLTNNPADGNLCFTIDFPYIKERIKLEDSEIGDFTYDITYKNGINIERRVYNTLSKNKKEEATDIEVRTFYNHSVKHVKPYLTQRVKVDGLVLERYSFISKSKINVVSLDTRTYNAENSRFTPWQVKEYNESMRSNVGVMAEGKFALSSQFNFEKLGSEANSSTVGYFRGDNAFLTELEARLNIKNLYHLNIQQFRHYFDKICKKIIITLTNGQVFEFENNYTQYFWLDEIDPVFFTRMRDLGIIESDYREAFKNASGISIPAARGRAFKQHCGYFGLESNILQTAYNGNNRASLGYFKDFAINKFFNLERDLKVLYPRLVSKNYHAPANVWLEEKDLGLLVLNGHAVTVLCMSNDNTKITAIVERIELV